MLNLVTAKAYCLLAMATVWVCAMGVLCPCAQRHVRKLDWRRLTGSRLPMGLHGSVALLGGGSSLWWLWCRQMPTCEDLQVPGGEASASPAELVRLSCPSLC